MNKMSMMTAQEQAQGQGQGQGQGEEQAWSQQNWREVVDWRILLLAFGALPIAFMLISIGVEWLRRAPRKTE